MRRGGSRENSSNDFKLPNTPEVVAAEYDASSDVLTIQWSESVSTTGLDGNQFVVRNGDGSVAAFSTASGAQSGSLWSLACTLQDAINGDGSLSFGDDPSGQITATGSGLPVLAFSGAPCAISGS